MGWLDKAIAKPNAFSRTGAKDGIGNVVGGVRIINQPAIGAEFFHPLCNVHNHRNRPHGHEHSARACSFFTPVSETRRDGFVERYGIYSTDAKIGDYEIRSLQRGIQLRYFRERHGDFLEFAVLPAESLDQDYS